MKKRRLLLCVFGSLALLIGLSTGNCAQAGEILIIVHIDVGVEELAQKTISEIYLGTRTKWDDELTIRVAMLKKGETHEQFTKEIVKTTPAKLKSFWKKVVFTGIGTPPKIFKKEDDLVEFVAETEGAIGYITKETSHEEVKTLSIVDTE